MRKKYYSLHGDAIDQNGQKHVVTVVGELLSGRQTKTFNNDVPIYVDDTDKTIPGTLTFSKNVLYRKLTVGISICAPLDEFDEEVGIKIAKSRIKKGEDAGILETNSVTMLTEDQVYAQLLAKLKWVCDHIDYYIKDSKISAEEIDNAEDYDDTADDSIEDEPAETTDKVETRTWLDDILDEYKAIGELGQIVEEDLKCSLSSLCKDSCCKCPNKTSNSKYDNLADEWDFIFGY